MPVPLEIRPANTSGGSGRSLDTPLFVRPSFRKAIAQEFRLEAVDVLLSSGDKQYCIPAFQRHSWLQGRQLVIGAGFDKTGRILGVSDHEYTQCLGLLSKQLGAQGVKKLMVRSTCLLPCHFDHSDKVELKVNLETSCASRLKNFSRSTRRNIQQPLKKGFKFSLEKSEEQLSSFYQLYLLHLHQLGSLPHSYQFFRQMLTDNPEGLQLFVGYMDGKAVVASLNIEDGPELYGAWMGVHPDYKKQNVFLCMLWLILEQCEREGKQYYNLGRSSVGSSAYHFKSRLADEINKIYYYDIRLNNSSTKKSKTLYDSASWLIRHSPPFVMNGLSRTLLSHFY